jgi:hypothetical protein
MLKEKSMMTAKRRKTMSTKSKTQTSKAHLVVNRVIFGLTDKEALVTRIGRTAKTRNLCLSVFPGAYLRRLPYAGCDRSYPTLR